jgi:hypothetical protein
VAPCTRPGDGDGLATALLGAPLPAPDGLGGALERAAGELPPLADEPPPEEVTAGEPPPPDDEPPPEGLLDGLALGLADAAELAPGDEAFDEDGEDGADDAGGSWPLVGPPGPLPPPTGPPTWLLFPPEAAPLLALTLPPS